MIERLDENGKVTQAWYEYAVECCKNGVEIFVPIDGYEESYEISNFGNIKSLERESWNGKVWWTQKERILSRNMNTNGYLSIQLCIDGSKRRRLIHVLEGIHFIPNPENKTQINHENGIKTCLELTNLSWCTPSENMKHAVRTGLLTPYRFPKKYGKDNLMSRPVIQCDLEGNYITEYECAKHASSITGIDNSSIGRCCKGKSKLAGMFTWKYSQAV